MIFEILDQVIEHASIPTLYALCHVSHPIKQRVEELFRFDSYSYEPGHAHRFRCSRHVGVEETDWWAYWCRDCIHATYSYHGIWHRWQILPRGDVDEIYMVGWSTVGAIDDELAQSDTECLKHRGKRLNELLTTIGNGHGELLETADLLRSIPDEKENIRAFLETQMVAYVHPTWSFLHPFKMFSIASQHDTYCWINEYERKFTCNDWASDQGFEFLRNTTVDTYIRSGDVSFEDVQNEIRALNHLKRPSHVFLPYRGKVL